MYPKNHNVSCTFKPHPWCSSSNAICQRWLAKPQSESQDITEKQVPFKTPWRSHPGAPEKAPEKSRKKHKKKHEKKHEKSTRKSTRKIQKIKRKKHKNCDLLVLFSGAFFVYLSLFLTGGRQKKHEKSTRKSTRKVKKNTQSNQRGRERSLIFSLCACIFCASKVLNLEGFAGLGIKIKFTV